MDESTQIQSSPTTIDPYNSDTEIPVAQVVSISRPVEYFGERIPSARVDGIVNESNQTVQYGNMVVSSFDSKKRRWDYILLTFLAISLVVVGVMSFVLRKENKQQVSPMPSFAPSLTASLRPSEAPTPKPTLLGKWDEVSQNINDGNTNRSSFQYGYSSSLSYDGTILAILHQDGITVWKQGSTTQEWNHYGNEIHRNDLIEGTDLTWADIMGDDTLITTYITLSANGKRFMWDVHFRENDSSRGIMILYQLIKTANSEEIWERVSEVVPLTADIGGRYYGPSVAYARVSGDIVLIPTEGIPTGLTISVWQFGSDTKWRQLGSALVSIRFRLFGASCAISGRGNTMGIATPLANGEIGREGKVEAFSFPLSEISNPTWERKGKDLWGDTSNNNFGIVSISNSGNEIAVGTPNEGRMRPGQVRMFRYSDEQDSWMETGTIEGPSKDNFGQIVSLSPNGKVVAIAAPKASLICVYKFVELSIIPRWELAARCVEESRVRDNYLWFSISLSEDGKRLLVGTPSEVSLESGGYGKVYELLEEQILK